MKNVCREILRAIHDGKLLSIEYKNKNAENSEYKLTPEQFDAVVREFQFDATSTRSGRTIKQICLNVLSINTKKGLYPLAYRKVYLDIKQRKFSSDAEITICKECTIDGSKQSIRAFLDADDLELLDDFDNNCEGIKDRIIENNPNMSGGVDDNPYLMGLSVQMDIIN